MGGAWSRNSRELPHRAYKGNEAFCAVKEKFGVIKAIQYTFKKGTGNAAAMLSATRTYKSFNITEQYNTIKGLISDGLSFALNNAKESTLERLENATLKTFGATKQARKAAEENLA